MKSLKDQRLGKVKKLTILVILSVSFISAIPMFAPTVHAFTCPLTGGSHKIEGCVVSSDNTSSPVSGLYVFIIECGGFTQTDWTITDGNGYFSFTQLNNNCINPGQSYVVSVNGVTPITWVTGCYVPSPCAVLGQNAYDLTWSQWAGDVQADYNNAYASITIPLAPGRQVMVPVSALYSNTPLASLSYTMSSSQTHSTTIGWSIGGGTTVQGSYTTSVTTTFSQTFNNAPNYASYLAAPYWAIAFYCNGSTVEANGPGGGWTCAQGIQNVGTTIATGGGYQFIRAFEHLNPNALPTGQPHLDCTFSVPVANTPWTWSYTQTGSTSTTFGVTSNADFFGSTVTLSYSESSGSENSDTTTVSFTTNGANLRFILYPAGGTCPNPNANPVFGDELHVWDLSPPPDFAISSSPSSFNVQQGSTPTSWSRTSTLYVQGNYGFGSDVSLTATSNDPNLILSLSPQTVNPLGSTVTSTLTVNDPSASDYGSYYIYVNGQGGGRFHQVVIPLSISVPDFTITATSPAQTRPGNYPTSTITITPLNGFTGTVNLATGNLPSGVNCQPVTPNTISGGSGTASLSCTGNAAATYQVTITASSGQLTHTSPATFTFTDFSLSWTFSGSTNLNSQAIYTVSVSGINGFSSTVNLSATLSSCQQSCGDGSPPTGMFSDTHQLRTTCTSYTCTRTFTVTTYNAVGQYQLYIMGSACDSLGCGTPTSTHNLVSDVWVQCNPTNGTPPGQFCLWPEANSVSASQNGVPGDWIYLDSNAGYSGTVSLSTSVSACFNACSSGTAPSSVWNDTRTTQTTSSINPNAANCYPGPYMWCSSRLLIIYAGSQTGEFTVTVTGTCPAGPCSFLQSHVVQIDFWVYTAGGGGSVAAGTLITLADHTQMAAQNLKVGMQVLSYDLSTHQYVTTTITRYFSVVTDNQLEIYTGTDKPLIVDQNPAQKLYVQLPDGTITLMSVTQLQVGYKLFNALSQQWAPITMLHYQNGGRHVMYDIYTSAPGNYIANGILDPLKM